MKCRTCGDTAGLHSIAAGTSQPPAIATPGATASATGAKPDDSALRYFAAQGDKRRLDAEMARLKSLYPNWTPPDDLFHPAPPADPAVRPCRHRALP